MKKIFAAVAIAIALCGVAHAQIVISNSEERNPAPYLGEENDSVVPPAVATVPDWYMGMDFGGFEFEIPAGCIVERGERMLVKYPDGTFGISMSSVEKTAPDQKTALEICKRLATSMHLPDPKVERVQCGKSSGAKASGILEGQQVTVLVLPAGDHEITTVILATPGRTEWVNHFLESLK